MKTLKLNKLNRNQLTKEQMKTIAGGTSAAPQCTCGCCYSDSGGSNTTDNGIANYDGSLSTRCEDIEQVWY